MLENKTISVSGVRKLLHN